MNDGADTPEAAVAHFPPGQGVPTAAQLAQRRSEALAKGRAAWFALSPEERSRKRAQKVLDRDQKAKKKAAALTGSLAPPTDADPVPPTVRSQRSTTLPGRPPPDTEWDNERPLAGPPRTLLDLCAAMPNLGDGSCFIQVTRIKPRVNSGVECAGILRPITEPVDDHEFAQAYGGTEYTLRGYEYNAAGRARPTTEPVPYRVPGPPNLASIPQPDEEPMQPRPHVPNGSPQFRRPGGIVSPQVATAEAEIHDRDLTHVEEMDARQRSEEERKRARLEQQRERQHGESLGMAKILAEAKDKEADRLAEAHRQNLQLMQGQRGGGADIVELLKVMKPGDDTAKLSAQHASEIRQITESHKEQITHLTDQQRLEVQRLTDMHTATITRLEVQMRADRDRSDAIIRETDKRAAEQASAADKRAAEQVAAAESRAASRVDDTKSQLTAQYNDLKTRSEERIQDQNKQWQQRFDDMKDAHARELKRKDDELVLMKTGLEGNVQILLNSKDTEMKRLQHDLRDAKAEAESNKNWQAKMKEAGAAAEALGYVKPEAGGDSENEESIKDAVIKTGLGVLQKLPELVTSVSEGIAKVRNPTGPTDPARGQSRSGNPRAPGGGMRTMPRVHGGAPPPQLMPLAFATEDGGYVGPSDNQVVQRPRMHAPEPEQLQLEQSPTQAMVPMQGPPPEPIQQQAPQPQPAPQQAAPSAPEPQAMQQANPSVPPPPPGAAVDGLDPAALQIIGVFAPMLAAQFEAKHQPPDIAKQIIADNSPDIVRYALKQLTIDQLLRFVTSNPGAHGQLASRAGQKFLRDVWRHAEELTGSAE